jgi:hypothetical protein
MKKHKLLYIPEGRYMKFKDENFAYIENVTFRNVKTDEGSSDPDKVIQALLTWVRTDTFFSRNDIPYPPSASWFEIVEVEVKDDQL